MLYYCMTEINKCKDWTKVEQDLQQKVHKLYKQNLNKEDFMKLMKMNAYSMETNETGIQR